jgi:hypothetical protein
MDMSAITATLNGFGLETWLAIGSGAFAFASFLLNWSIVRRQTAMQFESLKAQMDADMLQWAHEASDALSEGVLLARGRGSVFDEGELRRRALEAAQKLSSLADRGRLFFPNLQPDADGADREAAFRGYRPPILDAVVFGYFQLDRLDCRNLGPDAEAGDYLVRCRRLLVSELQNAIDPRRRGQMLRRLADKRRGGAGPDFVSAAALGEDLESRFPGLLVQRRDGQWIAERTAAVQGRK